MYFSPPLLWALGGVPSSELVSPRGLGEHRTLLGKGAVQTVVPSMGLLSLNYLFNGCSVQFTLLMFLPSRRTKVDAVHLL